MPAELRLLALDGGGVRGLSALMILEQLMEAVNPDAPPKPCDYFDMIGGTSTGGLIAIMLGRLKMSIDECIEAYLHLSDRIFRKKNHRVTIKGRIQGRFDSDELERAVKEVVTRQGLQDNALLKDAADATCKVFVCATSKQTSDTVCLTSYRSPRGNNDLLNSVKIWEACRATSAASSFFDPIAIGRYKEEFVDGGTGANNPVVELWNQAQLMWGPEPLEGKVRCLVSIGTGEPSRKPFRDDVLHIGETLINIATETEQTAERFRQDKSYLDSSGRYFRFNVIRGLEDIGLEESKKKAEMAAATRRYIRSQEVYKQMQACAGNLAGREYVGTYRINFRVKGVPRAKTFIDRPGEMNELERALLPQRRCQRQKVFVLHGMGGIGKTQLAAEFCRRYQRTFSAVLWFDGTSEESLKRSIAKCASRIPPGQISDTSRQYSADSSGDIDAVVEEVRGWLALPDNTSWLIVFDNVDREHGRQCADPLAYDVREYFPDGDHGFILVTSRLARLEQLGASQRVNKVDRGQAQAILDSWYEGSYDRNESKRLLDLLDGLPLAIAQAGAYLQESGAGLEKYIHFYEQQWANLVGPARPTEELIQEYGDRSVWTTWTISYEAIRAQDETVANLLLLWSFLDHKDLWYGLFAEACGRNAEVATNLSDWIGRLGSDEVEFTGAMRLLRNYSMIEAVDGVASYATHPVVHRWTYHYGGEQHREQLSELAVLVVGWAVPHNSERDYMALQKRLLSHAMVCSLWVGEIAAGDGSREEEKVLGAVHLLGDLYRNQGRLKEAGEMYVRALQGYEEALGPTHTSTLSTVNNLGGLYADQGKLKEAEAMYVRALQGYEEALGPTHTSTLSTVNNLGGLYADQGKLKEAEAMYLRALQGYKEALGPTHTSTLNIVNNLGNLYRDKGRLKEAEEMHMRALQGYKEALGPTHTSTLSTVNNLGGLYADQGKLKEAEAMYVRALQGREEALGPTHTSTLGTVNNLGNLYANQGRLKEAEEMYMRALQGYKEALGPTHTSTLNIVNNLGVLYRYQGKLKEAEEMYMRALQGYKEAMGTENVRAYLPALNTMCNLGLLFAELGQNEKAARMYAEALPGFTALRGADSEDCRRITAHLEALSQLRVGKEHVTALRGGH